MHYTINIIGPLPLGETPTLDTNHFTIFVDGGIHHLHDGFAEHISIGDSDSTTASHSYQLPQEKDRSDLYHALELTPPNTSSIEFYGLYGGRLDHQIMVLGEIHHFLKRHPHISACALFHSEGRIQFYNAGLHETTFDGHFSLLCLEENTNPRLGGEVKYPISEKEASNIQALSSQGLSNIASGKIKIQCDLPLIAFFCDTLKA